VSVQYLLLVLYAWFIVISLHPPVHSIRAKTQNLRGSHQLHSTLWFFSFRSLSMRNMFKFINLLSHRHLFFFNNFNICRVRILQQSLFHQYSILIIVAFSLSIIIFISFVHFDLLAEKSFNFSNWNFLFLSNYLHLFKLRWLFYFHPCFLHFLSFKPINFMFFWQS